MPSPPEAVPEIDLLLVTHAHFDHLDTPSLAAVPGAPAVVMAHGTSDLLPRRRTAAVHELRWNESVRVRTPRGDAQVHAIEVRHWGARVQRDTWRGYTGFVVEREGRRLLIGGDTADTPVFRDHRRHGPFDAALMPIGAYDPWIRHHCTPEQAIRMADAAGARLFVPIHHQSFRLSREPVREPIERAEAMLGQGAGTPRLARHRPDDRGGVGARRTRKREGTARYQSGETRPKRHSAAVPRTCTVPDTGW